MTRIDIINLLASYIRARDYLEIGVRYGRCLSCIKAPNRVGVDPAPVLHKVEPEYHAGLEGVGLYVCTSDKFFAKYAKTYDLVFVDGMHLYEFAMRDLLNSMNHLNPGGFVVMHDLCPRDAVTAARDRESTVWNGDVWKVALDVHRNHPGIGCFVVNDDHGVGVFWKRDEQDFQPRWRREYQDIPFAYYEKHHPEFQTLVDPTPEAVMTALRAVERTATAPALVG